MKLVTMWFNTCVYKGWVCIYMLYNQNEYREELGFKEGVGFRDGSVKDPQAFLADLNQGLTHLDC